MLQRETRFPFWLDHVSVRVTDLRAAVELFASRLGLHITASAADPDRHGRIHLDRSYLEVSAQGSGVGWQMPQFFLRFADPAALRRHLEASGLSCRFGSYTGADGRWDDVAIEADGVPLPILVRRTEPAEVADDWPPALSGTHRCGARTLEAVHVTVPDLEATLGAYTRLLGSAAVARSRPDGRAVLGLESGRIVLSESASPGVAGIVLGVTSLGEAAAVAGPLSAGPIGWVDPAASHGLRVGFTEVAA